MSLNSFPIVVNPRCWCGASAFFFDAERPAYLCPDHAPLWNVVRKPQYGPLPQELVTFKDGNATPLSVPPNFFENDDSAEDGGCLGAVPGTEDIVLNAEQSAPMRKLLES